MFITAKLFQKGKLLSNDIYIIRMNDPTYIKKLFYLYYVFVLSQMTFEKKKCIYFHVK